MRPTETPIAIVGAGAAGLSAAGAMKKRGLDPLVLDRDSEIGGTWARRYERLCLHTIRRFSGLAHFRIPDGYPRYVPKDLFAQYLRDYARQSGLRVQLDTPVHRIRSEDAGWCVDTDGQSIRAQVVVVATGHYNEPQLPDWPGAEGFAGRLLHSVDYSSGAEFAGRKALVVGIGNSGAEIATDLVEQGASAVTIAVRTPPPIISRDLFGLIPVQLLGLAFTAVPAPRLLDRAGAALRRLAMGDLSRFGLNRAAWGPFAARRPPMIDVGFVGQLKAGRIRVRPSVTHFTEKGVVFADGEEDEFDVVVAATGFRTGLRGLLELPGAVGDNGLPLFRSGRPTPYAGLYFIGFDENVRGHLFEANRESRRLARSVERYLAPRESERPARSRRAPPRASRSDSRGRGSD